VLSLGVVLYNKDLPRGISGLPWCECTVTGEVCLYIGYNTAHGLALGPCWRLQRGIEAACTAAPDQKNLKKRQK
jgi:hypothetical protein